MSSCSQTYSAQLFIGVDTLSPCIMAICVQPIPHNNIALIGHSLSLDTASFSDCSHFDSLCLSLWFNINSYPIYKDWMRVGNITSSNAETAGEFACDWALGVFHSGLHQVNGTHSERVHSIHFEWHTCKYRYDLWHFCSLFALVLTLTKVESHFLSILTQCFYSSIWMTPTIIYNPPFFCYTLFLVLMQPPVNLSDQIQLWLNFFVCLIRTLLDVFSISFFQILITKLTVRWKRNWAHADDKITNSLTGAKSIDATLFSMFHWAHQLMTP